MADPARVSMAELVRPPFNVWLASAAAAAAALDDDELLKMTREEFDAEVKYVQAFLDAHDAVPLRRHHGNMLFVELTELAPKRF